MEDLIQWSWIGFIFVFISGTYLIVAPFVSTRNWTLKRANVKWERIGLDISAEGRTLLIVIGAIMVAGSGHALYRIDHQRTTEAIERANGEKKRFEALSAELRILLEEGRKSDLDLVPSFEGVDAKFESQHLDFYSNVLFEVKIDGPSGDQVIVPQESLFSGNNEWELKLEQLHDRILLSTRNMTSSHRIDVTASYSDMEWVGYYRPPMADIYLAKISQKNEGDEQ